VDNKRTTYLTIALSILLLFVLLVIQQALKEDSTIVLPEYTTEADTDDGNSSADGFNALSVSPKTVQTAISTLSRPASYKRTQTVEIFWSSGSSTSSCDVAVHSGMTRIDTTLADNSVCHVLMTADTAAVWYDDETAWTTLHAEEFTADSLQRMPTYETVLEITVASIAQAEYCEKDGTWCIFVQTRQNMDGYTEKYWISVQSGLLYAAERLYNDSLIYRFTASEPETAAPEESLFLLPDGSKLT